MLRYRAPPLLALSMLSPARSSSSSSYPLLQGLKPVSEISRSSSHCSPNLLLSPRSDQISVSGSGKFTQFMSLSGFCSGPTAAIPISGAAELNESDSEPLVVVSFYKFADFPDHGDLRKPLKELCQELRVSGGIILAPEGINGSICGTRESVERVLGFIQSDSRLKGLRRAECPVSPEEEAIHHGHTSSSPLAAGEDAPFRWDHVRVKLKKEIVTLGMPAVSPIARVGKYVKPKDWNALISDPDTVYHLEGGILKYLEEVPEKESLWEGECFVFDKRVSVEHGLEQGSFKLCYGCKQPVSDKDMEAPEWEYGVSCPYCYSSKSDGEKERARARQRQFETWGIIGGPDKGRRPISRTDDDHSANFSKSA